MTTKTGSAQVPHNLGNLPGLVLREGTTIWLCWNPTVIESDPTDSSIELFLEIKEDGRVVSTYEFEDTVLGWNELPAIMIDVERSIALTRDIELGERPDAAYLMQVFDAERLSDRTTWRAIYQPGADAHLLVQMAFSDIRHGAPLEARIPRDAAGRFFREYPGRMVRA